MLRSVSNPARRTVRHVVKGPRLFATEAPRPKPTAKTVQTVNGVPPAPGKPAPTSSRLPLLVLGAAVAGTVVWQWDALQELTGQKESVEDIAEAAVEVAKPAVEDAAVVSEEETAQVEAEPEQQQEEEVATMGETAVEETGEEEKAEAAETEAVAEAEAEAAKEEEEKPAEESAVDIEVADAAVSTEAEEDQAEEEVEEKKVGEEEEVKEEEDPVDAGIQRRTVVVTVEEDATAKDAVASAAELALEASKSIEALRVQSLREAADMAAEAMRAEVSRAVDAELEGLDEAALRTRVLSLARELHDVHRWEGVRLAETMQQAEERLAERYAALLRAQAEQQGATHRAELASLRERLQTTLQAELDAQREALLAEARRVIDARVDQIVAGEREEAASALQLAVAQAQAQEAENTAATAEQAKTDAQRMTRQFEALQTEVRAVHAVFSDHSSYARASFHSHQVAFAALTFQQRLNNGQPLAPALHILRAAAASDRFLSAAVAAFPARAQRRGVSTREQLASRFQHQLPRARRAVFAPATESLLGDVLAMAMAWLVSPPDVDGRGAIYRDQLTSSVLVPGRVLATAAADADEAGDAAGEAGAALGATAEAAMREGMAEAEAEAEAEAAGAGTETEGEVSEADAAAAAEAEARRAAWAARAAEEAERAAAERRAQQAARVSARRDSDVRLHRAAALLRDGKLAEAVEQVELIDGQAGAVLKPWLRDAKERLAVEMMARAVGAHASCLAAALN